jgi:hypothetical protein
MGCFLSHLFYTARLRIQLCGRAFALFEGSYAPAYRTRNFRGMIRLQLFPHF